MNLMLPLLTIVGRPNVGKSTLFNRLVGSRRAIVGDEPGITRDRLYGETDWNGRRLRVVDTGGIIPEDKELIPSEIFRQARVALDEASAIVMVVDGRTELASPDMELARLLIRTGKPLVLAVNKIDTLKQEPYAEEYRRLGIKELIPVSAEHGNGIVELLEHVLQYMPEPAQEAEAETEKEKETGPSPQPEIGDEEGAENEPEPRETKVAIIGRPNVGKSTLLNALAGTARAIVSPIAGTTRDAIDEVVDRDGKLYRFIDTAGIRRKGKTKEMAEKLSVVMARRHIRMAQVVLLVLDAVEGVLSLDATIAGYAHEGGRALILCVNKWDQVAEGKKRAFERDLRDHFKFLDYAPVVFLSAKTGAGVKPLFKLIRQVFDAASKRVSTGELNRFTQSLHFEERKIMYITQASVRPPTFVLFTNSREKLHFSHERYLMNQMRKRFGFVGTPIVVKTKGRTEKKRA
jgi:GTP-binding protein